jgi:hypothetical protein
VNAALLVISSALATGGDVIPAGGLGDTPIIIQVQGCTNCGPIVASSCGCAKPSLLDKLKARFAPKPHCGCAPAPTCNSCEKVHRPNLLDKIKSWSCKKPTCGCGPVVSPCVTPGAPVIVPGTPTTTPPKDMPKLKEVPKTSGNTGTLTIPSAPPALPIAPNPVGIPTVPAAPISTGTAPSGNSPY